MLVMMAVASLLSLLICVFVWYRMWSVIVTLTGIEMLQTASPWLKMLGAAVGICASPALMAKQSW